jgi:phosphoglycerate dehydrogenase-like enzyme
MKPSAFLINTSRGPLVHEGALLDTLRNRRIAGAGLDVYNEEPLPVNHPLLELDNVVLSPHLGYVTTDNFRGFFTNAVEDIVAFQKGAPVRVIPKS